MFIVHQKTQNKTTTKTKKCIFLKTLTYGNGETLHSMVSIAETKCKKKQTKKQKSSYSSNNLQYNQNKNTEDLT